MKLKKLGKVLEDTREVSMQEVIFRLFGYAMCKSSRKNKFIQTQAPEKRDGLLKGYLDQLGDNDQVFCYNIIDYYQARPESLKKITLASFAADYEYFTKKTTKNTKQTKNTNTEDGNLQEGDKSQDDNQEEGDKSQDDNQEEGVKSQDDNQEEGDKSQADNSQDDKSKVHNSEVDNLEEDDNCQDDKEEHKGEDDNIEEDDNNDEHDNMEKKKIYLLNNMGYLKKGRRVQL